MCKIIELSALNGLSDLKYDFVERRGSFIIHRQVERRNGLTFMRMKRRPAVIVRRNSSE